MIAGEYYDLAQQGQQQMPGRRGSYGGASEGMFSLGVLGQTDGKKPSLVDLGIGGLTAYLLFRGAEKDKGGYQIAGYAMGGLLVLGILGSVTGLGEKLKEAAKS